MSGKDVIPSEEDSAQACKFLECWALSVNTHLCHIIRESAKQTYLEYATMGW